MEEIIFYCMGSYALKGTRYEFGPTPIGEFDNFLKGNREIVGIQWDVDHDLGRLIARNESEKEKRLLA